MTKENKIAVVVAANPRNSGMYTVDLAGKAFFDTLPGDHTLFCAQTGRGHESFGKLKFKQLDSAKDLRDFTHIVFWGDFLNSPAYGRGDFAKRDVDWGHSATRNEGYERWLDIFAHPRSNDEQIILSVGNNFQNMTPKRSAEFADAMMAIQDNFDTLLPRDPLSLQHLHQTFGSVGRAKTVQGLDCAFLFPQQAPVEKTGTFGYHFGRSGFDDVAALIESVEVATGRKGVQLSRWLSLNGHKASHLFPQMMNQILASDFILTDIYHLSINSLNQGTPVFAMGQHSVEQEGTLGDLKKRYLFDMIGRGEDYLERSQLEATPSYYQRVCSHIAENLAKHPGRVGKVDELRAAFSKDVWAALFPEPRLGSLRRSA